MREIDSSCEHSEPMCEKCIAMWKRGDEMRQHTPVTMNQELTRLVEAVRAIYYVAVWRPDRFVSNETELWTELRDAAGFEPDHSPAAVEANARLIAAAPRMLEILSNMAAIPDTPGKVVNMCLIEIEKARALLKEIDQ